MLFVISIMTKHDGNLRYHNYCVWMSTLPVIQESPLSMCDPDCIYLMSDIDTLINWRRLQLNGSEY